MIKIGLTGGIGSGKSTVAQIFEVLGIPVYYADAASKRLMNENDELKHKIKSAFGEETYTNGVLNRKYLSDIVFKDAEKINLLNSLVHPVTIKDAAQWMQKQTTPYVIKEAALIFESSSNKDLDYVIGVKSPAELRIKRTMARDNISLAQVQARIDRQMNEEEKINLCNYVIVNDEHQMLIPQVLALHEKFLKLPGY
ncbi:MAG TPA: dephospho-CoA kinase [Ginsengibacter sp.]